MGVEQAATTLNWLDWVLVLATLMGVLTGVRRGLVFGTLDLVQLGASIAAAFLLYQPVAALVGRLIPDAPSGLAPVGSFLLLLVVAPMLISLVVGPLYLALRPLLAAGPVRFVDRTLGVFPGGIRALLLFTLGLLPFVLFPLVPQVSAAVEQSTVTHRLVTVAVATVPRIEDAIGQDLREGLPLIAPPQIEEGMRLDLQPTGVLRPDPDAEQRMFGLVNQERVKIGLRPLVFDDRLRDVARAHSREMFEQGYFAHESPISGSPFDRLQSAGVSFLVAGENLAYAPSVEVAHAGLMRSPGHRENILRPQFGRVGIGVIRSELRGSMFTQEFTN